MRKKIAGRKRSTVTDALGLLLAVLVTAASVQDSVAGTHLIDEVVAAHPSVRKVWFDGGYRQHLVEHTTAALGIDMETVRRIPGTRGFTPLPTRWTVEARSGPEHERLHPSGGVGWSRPFPHAGRLKPSWWFRQRRHDHGLLPWDLPA